MISVLFVALFALILGLAFCFAGYRVFLVMLPIWGFFAGFWLGAEATALIFGAGFLATTTSWVVGFVVGLVGALLSYLVYTLGVMILAGIFGFALANGLMNALGFESGLIVALVPLLGAVVLMVLAIPLNLQKYLIIAITAVGGANTIVLSGLLLLGQVSLDSLRGSGNAIAPVLQGSWFWLVIWLVLAIAGFFVQFRLNRAYEFNREQYLQGWG